MIVGWHDENEVKALIVPCGDVEGTDQIVHRLILGTLQGVKWNEGDILTVGWCALRGGQEDGTFPPLLQVRCLHIGEVLLSH